MDNLGNGDKLGNGFFNSNGYGTSHKALTCKAAVAWGPGQPLVIEEIQVEPPQKMEVRIKILFTSICHTDLMFLKGENKAQQAFPRILGHEASGEVGGAAKTMPPSKIMEDEWPRFVIHLCGSHTLTVNPGHPSAKNWVVASFGGCAPPNFCSISSSSVIESVGEGVTEMKEGDHVVPIFNGECGDCVYCKSKATNLCEMFRANAFRSVMVPDGKTRFSTKDGKPIFHFMNTSTFSEYTVINSACVVKIDPEAPLKKMTLLSCGVSSGLGAVWNTANVPKGSSVAVFGLGAVGLAVVEGARNRGASKIFGVDINPNKLLKGHTIGITHSINSKEIKRPVFEEIRELTEGGVDYSFECAGNLDVFRDAFLSTHDGWGLTVMLGIHPTPRMLPLHPMELFDGRRIVGSTFGDFKGKSQLPILAKECMSGVVKLDEFITHELPFAKINEAFQLLIDGKSLRCVLHL